MTSPTQSQSPSSAQLVQALQKASSPASCRTETVDFASIGFVEHEDSFAMLIHDLLTPDECDALLHAAEASTSGHWHAALINTGHSNELVTEVRLCDRIMWDDAAVAGALWARIEPHLPADIKTLFDRPEVTGDYEEEWVNGTWAATRLNERLRFLRYTPGMYFREHFDAHYITPDGTEVSFLTVHLYLRGSDDLRGGATRFFAMDRPGHEVHYDVDPKPGSCLVFQHYDLTHSGEDVSQGTKYTLRTDLMYRKIGG